LGCFSFFDPGFLWVSYGFKNVKNSFFQSLFSSVEGGTFWTQGKKLPLFQKKRPSGPRESPGLVLMVHERSFEE
jgi:hypothetical protein